MADDLIQKTRLERAITPRYGSRLVSDIPEVEGRRAAEGNPKPMREPSMSERLHGVKPIGED